MPSFRKSHSRIARMVRATTIIGPDTRRGHRFMIRSAAMHKIDMISVAAQPNRSTYAMIKRRLDHRTLNTSGVRSKFGHLSHPGSAPIP
jgi:hypothetical protein